MDHLEIAQYINTFLGKFETGFEANAVQHSAVHPSSDKLKNKN